MKSTLLSLMVLLSVCTLNAQWQKIQSTSTDVKGFAQSSTKMFAAVYNSGVYVSADNGGTWTLATNTGLTSKIITSIVYGELNLFVSVFDASGKGGVYISSNDGASWSSVSTNISSYVSCLMINGTVLYAGTDVGVYKSIDKGTTWTKISTGLPTGSFATVTSLVVGGTTLFAGTGDGVFKSVDNGANWTLASTGITDINIKSLMVKGTDVFAGSTSGIFVSSDNGATWKAAGNAPSKTYFSLTTKRSYIFAGTSTDGVYWSADNGVTWKQENNGLVNKKVSSIALSDTTILIGTADGIWKNEYNKKITLLTQPQGASKTVGMSFTTLVTSSGLFDKAQWYKGTSIIPGAVSLLYTIPSVKLTDAGDYSCEVSNDVSTVKSNIATLNVALGIQSANQNSNIKIYPNPVNDYLNIEGTFTSAQILNISGQTLLQVNETNTIDVSALSSGVYLIKIYNGDTTEVLRFVK